MMTLMTIAGRITVRMTPNVIQSVLLDPSETEKEKIIISYYLSYYFQNNNSIFYNYFHNYTSLIITNISFCYRPIVKIVKNKKDNVH